MNYKSKISDEMLENGFADNSFTRRDTDGFYIKLQSFIGDGRIAANILVLAIRQAGIETASYDTRDIEFQVDNFIQREIKTIAEAKAIIEKRNKKPLKKGDARETVQDWDKQKVDGITPEEQEHLDDLMLWFNDRDKYHGAEDETYKQIATFDAWQEWRKKRAISGH